jgi:hypothetical protein
MEARTGGLITDADARGAALGVVGGEPTGETTLASTTGRSIDALLWRDLLTFRVPGPIRQDLAARRISVNDLSNAYGDVNLDYYPIRISELPTVDGKKLDAEGFLSYFRQHFNDEFVDTDNSRFEPLDDAVDKPKWSSSDPLGAVIDIAINVAALLSLPPWEAFTDHGLVVCSRHSATHWVFSTCRGSLGPSAAGNHPVTGNRMWAIGKAGTGWVLYTMGADRVTSWLDRGFARLVWRGADALWRSMQHKTAAFINGHHGKAEVVTHDAQRYSWTEVLEVLEPGRTIET